MVTKKKVVGFIIPALIFLIPNRIFAQAPITVDNVSFPVYTSGNSGFTNYLTPDKDVVYRQKAAFSSTRLSQPSNYRVITRYNDSILSKWLIDSSGISGFAGNATSFHLKNNKAELNAKEIWFNGDWMKIPVIAGYPGAIGAAIPEGGLVYSQQTGSLLKSNGLKTIPAYWEFPDSSEINPYILETKWTKQIGYENLPLIRLRHPLNVTNFYSGNDSRDRDFTILPYQYGMAIDYNGVVECWVGEWSIHKGHNYIADVENNNNKGWGAVFWVGDDEDRGGIRGTARDAPDAFYSELSSEKFDQRSHGPLRLRVVDPKDSVQIIHGGRGSRNVSLYVTKDSVQTILGVGNNKNLALNTGGQNRVTILSNGHVGIGVSEPTAAVDIESAVDYNQLRLRKKFTPTSSTDERGRVGSVSWDDNYMYIKTETGWKRTSLQPF